MAATNGSDNIAILLEKKSQRQRVLEQILELLDRAEEKLRYDKKSWRKWNRILTRLEDSFVEAKRGVAECDALIDVERWRAKKAVDKPDESRVLAQAEPEPSAVESDPEKRAAYKIAQAPIEKLPSISLQDAAFARAYTARRAFGAHDREFRKRLSTRLELASQLPRLPQVRPDQGERRNQNMLREAIVKVQKGKIENMRDEEIDLVVGCYKVLSGRLVSDANKTRLLEIISGMIETLKAERSRRHLESR